jgi:hypothetical protein
MIARIKATRSLFCWVIIAFAGGGVLLNEDLFFDTGGLPAQGIEQNGMGHREKLVDAMSIVQTAVKIKRFDSASLNVGQS